MSDVRVQALEMFRGGQSVNAVAVKLFKNYFAKAKALREELIAAGELEAKPTKPQKNGKPKKVREAEADAPDCWELTVNVPTERMDAIFARFTLQEKADAIEAVLQARVGAD